MTQQGATLQNYNNELVKCIEDLREKREEVNKSINEDEEEKAKIQNDLRILTERLARINDNLARKISSRNEYDKTIQETEAAYSKVRRAPRLLAAGAGPGESGSGRHGSSWQEGGDTRTRVARGRAPRNVGYKKSPGSPRLRIPRVPRGLPSSHRACPPSCVQIMESSQTLLHVLKREQTNLTKKSQASS